MPEKPSPDSTPPPPDPGTTRSPFKLKPKTDFTVTNPPIPRGEASPDHDVWALRQAAGDGTRPPLPGDDPDALEFPDLEPIEIRPSRRRRDYWFLMILGNSVLGLITFFGWGNPFLQACGLGGMAAYTLSLTWVMWFVISRY
ncbi:hypothetical protein [Actomonas aquatica]|uniref:Uncharacterized protein n=1 Tax=Actomonas aquatica TaxID=2866162 RepID=A0ABZ1C4Y5_9BACT|nr:hypothetical protein [Opitutus sp. WL0086]WRQ86710.1 hypothetical protein K1X11_018005 [Opitutus sp. WL0086]